VAKGQFPKAYLRIDPNIDQNPDMALIVRVMCAANRQLPRGGWKTWAHVVTALGAKAARLALIGKHVVEEAGGRWVVPHWDTWQEGDVTVGERMRRLRERRKGDDSVTPDVTVDVTDEVTATVTPNVTEQSSPDRITLSEALGVRRNGERTYSACGADSEAPPTRNRRRKAFAPQDPRTAHVADQLIRIFNTTAEAWGKRTRDSANPGILRAVDAALCEGYRPGQLVYAVLGCVRDEWYLEPGRGVATMLTYSPRPIRGGGMTTAHLPKLLATPILRDAAAEALRRAGVPESAVEWPGECPSGDEPASLGGDRRPGRPEGRTEERSLFSEAPAPSGRTV
jgi:hypothetical protein